MEALGGGSAKGGFAAGLEEIRGEAGEDGAGGGGGIFRGFDEEVDGLKPGERLIPRTEKE